MANAHLHIALILAAAALAMLFSGCIGSPGLGACSSLVNSADQDTCVNYNAVIDQVPTRCYEVRNMTLREQCLKDSNDPAAAQRLIDQAAQEEMARAAAQQNLAFVPAPVPEADPVAVCVETQKISREGCMRAVAIETGNMSKCAEILAGDYRASCISNIALTYRNLADCNVLKNEADTEICRKYVQGS